MVCISDAKTKNTVKYGENPFRVIFSKMVMPILFGSFCVFLSFIWEGGPWMFCLCNQNSNSHNELRSIKVISFEPGRRFGDEMIKE